MAEIWRVLRSGSLGDFFGAMELASQAAQGREGPVIRFTVQDGAGREQDGDFFPSSLGLDRAAGKGRWKISGALRIRSRKQGDLEGVFAYDVRTQMGEFTIIPQQ